MSAQKQWRRRHPRLAQPPAGLCLNNNAMAKQKQSPGEPMKLGNMRHLGAQRLVASCLNDGFSGASLRFICARTELKHSMTSMHNRQNRVRLLRESLAAESCNAIGFDALIVKHGRSGGKN